MPRHRHRQHGNPFNLREAPDPIDCSDLYGREAPIALDIGFGGGRFTMELARQHPSWNVLGLEIREHWVTQLNERARQEKLSNLHALLANANLHLDTLLPDSAVIFVSINFPDPWYKKRHHKRRVVRADWLKVLFDKLLAGAEIHVATDYELLGIEMRALLDITDRLTNLHGSGRFAPASTTGIETEREQTHSERGEPIFRLHYRFDE